MEKQLVENLSETVDEALFEITVLREIIQVLRKHTCDEHFEVQSDLLEGLIRGVRTLQRLGDDEGAEVNPFMD